MTRSRAYLAFASFLTVLILAACAQQPAVPGSIAITVTGLEAGVDTLVNVTGPNGYSTQVSVTTTVTLQGLAPGEYVVDGSMLSFTSVTNDGFEVFDAPPVNATVASATVTDAAVTYAYRGLDIMDPANDAVADVPIAEHFIYDVVRLWTVVEGDSVVVTIEYRADQTDFSLSTGNLYIDVDQDDTTGDPSDIGDYCTEGSKIGTEFVLFFAEIGDDSMLVTYPDYSTVTVVERVDTGSSSTFAIPLDAIGGDGRVDMELVVGNWHEPTDCLARGEVDFVPGAAR